MSGIVAFLNARLDEDQAAAEADLDEAALVVYNSATAHPRRKPCDDFALLPLPVQERYRALTVEGQPRVARALREVKAKRELMDLAFEHAAKIDGEWGCCHSPESIRAGRCEDERPEHQRILRTLAALYDEHPDYDLAWAGDIEA